MVAPIDAKAVLTIGEGEEAERFTLVMNMRTLALAKSRGVNLLAMTPGQNVDPLELAVVVRSFAEPNHPDMTEEEAFAIACRFGAETDAVLGELGDAFSPVAEGANARPTKARQKKG